MKHAVRGMAVWAAVLGAGLAPGGARAGNGPQNLLVVYDPSDPNNTALAQYYKDRRGFPESNLVAYDFPKAPPSLAIKRVIEQDECWALIAALRQAATNRGISRVHGVVLVGTTPLNVRLRNGNQNADAAITSALWASPNCSNGTQLAAFLCAGTYSGGAEGFLNKAYNTNTTREIRSDISFGGERYWIASHAGFTGVSGLRVAEAKSLIDRSVGADGTREAGTIYWPINGDIRATTRLPQIAGTTNQWNAMGLAHWVFGKDEYGNVYNGDNAYRYVAKNKNGSPGSLPINQRAVQGMVCGFSMPVGLEFATNRYTKGAICEHLTSFGGVMGAELFNNVVSNVGPQMALSEWLRWGACGASGTVAEPLAIAGKFPHASIHTHYARGATLAEAFLQAVRSPWMLLVSGDALCQPYAQAPTVTLTGPTNDAVLSGTVAITASASAGSETNLDLFVDGKFVASSSGNFSLNTTQLADGFHQLRAVAYRNDAIRTQGSAVRRVFVNNQNSQIAISSATGWINYRGEGTVTVGATNISGVERVELRANGHTLARMGATGGTTRVAGHHLGHASSNQLFAVAVKNGGGEVWSLPRSVNPSWANLPPGAPLNAPVQAGALAVARLWTNASNMTNFNWTYPNQTQVLTGRKYLIFENAPGSIGFPMVTTNMFGKAAMEFETWFRAETADLYDFAVGLRGYGSNRLDCTMVVNGREIISGAKGDLSWGSERLAAGFHQVLVRVKYIAAESNIRAGVRSAYGRMVPETRPENAVLDFAPLQHTTNCAVLVSAPAVVRDLQVEGNGLAIGNGDWWARPEDHTSFGSSTGIIERTFTVRNPGTGTVAISWATVAGLDAPAFQVSQSPPRSLAGGASGTFKVRMNTTVAGEKQALVYIYNDTTNKNPYSFAISGVRQSSLADVQAEGNGVPIANGDTTPSTGDHTDFGSAIWGGGTVTRTFTLRNTGGAALSVGPPYLSGANAVLFGVTAAPSNNVAPGATTTFQVRFNPSNDGEYGTGARDAVVGFTNNAAGKSPYTFAIRGTSSIRANGPEAVVRYRAAYGEPFVVVASGDTTPSAAEGTDFGAVPVGSSLEREYFITNAGASNLVVSGVTLTGAHAADYTVSRAPTTSPLGTSYGTTFRIRFTPSAAGTRTAVANIANNDADENPYTFALKGN